MTNVGTLKSLEPLCTCHLCCVICGVSVHVRMWRAAGVSVYVRGLLSAKVPRSSFAEVRRILLSEPTHMEDEDEDEDQENEKEDERR